MKRVLPLFVFIDACGWEIVRNDPFAQAFAPQRKRLRSVFGYSSACVPSIVSGRWPAQHRHWCYFVYDPQHSPFKALRSLRWLPRPLTSRRRFRHWLSKMMRARLGFEGYFDLYNIPFEHIALFDFSEKRSPLRPRGLNSGSNLFDFLEREHIAYSGSVPEQSEEANLAALLQKVESEQIDFGFLYWPGLDALLHRVGNQSSLIGPHLRGYEAWIQNLLTTARRHYQEVQLFVFSDHGMANCDERLDLRAAIEALPLQFGKDYAVVYDSTMARFWFLNPQARARIVERLENIPQGRILPDEELERLGALFADHYFGELVFLVREGVLIVPSFMGERPIRAMHGYHPDEPQSYALLCTNQPSIPEDIVAIPDLYQLMTNAALQARGRNAEAAGVAASEAGV